jgi:hypothetical protein
MSFEIKRDKQYIALILKDPEINKEMCEEIKDAITANMEAGARNFILNMKAVKETGADFYASLDTIMNILIKEEGMLVVAGCKNGESKTIIENKGIIAVKTMDEAVDYVFMEQLEKQLRTGGEEDLDDF